MSTKDTGIEIITEGEEHDSVKLRLRGDKNRKFASSRKKKIFEIEEKADSEQEEDGEEEREEEYNGDQQQEEEEEEGDDGRTESPNIELKLAISKDLTKRVTNFTSPFINAIISGNVHTLDYLLQQGLSCPLENMNASYALSAGYHIEEIAEAMLEMIHCAAKACMGDVEQEFPPCQGCREKLREQSNTRGGHKLF